MVKNKVSFRNKIFGSKKDFKKDDVQQPKYMKVIYKYSNILSFVEIKMYIMNNLKNKNEKNIEYVFELTTKIRELKKIKCWKMS